MAATMEEEWLRGKVVAVMSFCDNHIPVYITDRQHTQFFGSC